MSLAELLALVEKSPETLLILWVAFQTLSLALGGVGTALESIGLRHDWPGLQRFGQRVEGFFSELPKTIRGSRYSNYIEAKIDAAVKTSESIEAARRDLARPRSPLWEADYRHAVQSGMTTGAARAYADKLAQHPSRKADDS